MSGCGFSYCLEMALFEGISWDGARGCGAYEVDARGLFTGPPSIDCFLERVLLEMASLGSFLLSGERFAMLAMEASLGFFNVGFGEPFFSVGESINR
jgi:hypothetical protein